MINRTSTLPETSSDSVAAMKIKALYKTYKNGGAEIYCQTVGGKTTAVISRLGSGFTLLSFDGADYDELDSFFSYLSGEVFCESEDAKNLNAPRKSLFPCLCYCGEIPTVTDGERVKISSIYSLLENGSDGDIELPPFEDWYTDFCMRVNHFSADFFVLDGVVAVAGFMTDNSALITGVAVDKSCRGKGLGSKALKGLIAKINAKQKKQIFAVANSETARFYIKNGFQIDGECAVLKY